MDVERIIECIKQHDHEGLRTQLQQFNKEYAQCFFFDVEEWERKKRQELEEFKRNKVRDPGSDSDLDDESSEDREIFLRQSLASILIRFLRSDPHSRVIRVCLRTLRILSRDKKVLDSLLTDSSLITLARLAGFSQTPDPGEELDDQADLFGDVMEALSGLDSNDGENGEDEEPSAENPDANNISALRRRRSSVFKALMRGKRDIRASVVEDEDKDEEEDGKGAQKCEEEQNKEAVKILCNVIYNSAWAQERAAELSLLSGLTAKLDKESQSASTPSGQYYELRLIFLLTALRPELRNQLKQEGGVVVLTTVLERCVSVQWKEQYEVAPLEPDAALVSVEDSLRAQEVLKILFNITHSAHSQDPDEENATLYRRLAAVLRHCLLVRCEGEEETEELKGHTVNLLSALPLSCLDVLLCVPLQPDSEQMDGVNMDCVHSLLVYLERRLEKGEKVKARLTPVLNLLTECSRAHRGTRRYLRQQILPPLRDVSMRPEEGSTVKSRLVRLMTHLDTELKHCAADLLFVLCKENVRRFVKYTGYGNAAGLLATRGLLGGQRSKGTSSGTRYSSDSDSDTEEYRQVKSRINPVTGRLEEELPDPMEGMTEEEKEEEARRLVSLINKLSKDNMIQPMGLDAQGQLTPLASLRDLTEEEEGSEEEEEEGADDLLNVE
uniref:Synembryn n=2 Tax=Astyanax mexicanus TaxID=7994 RepID=W5LPP0_ASTMX